MENTVKTVFEGLANIAKTAEPCSDSHYLTFKLWEKGGMRRIYINDYKRRTLGYIEDGNVIIKDRQGNTQSEVDTAVNTFLATYSF